MKLERCLNAEIVPFRLIPPRSRPLGCDRLLCVLGLTNLSQFVQQAGAPLDLDWNVTACFLPLLLALPLRLDAAADRSRRRDAWLLALLSTGMK